MTFVLVVAIYLSLPRLFSDRTILPGLALVVVASPFILVPIRVHSTHWHSADPVLESIDLGDPSHPQEFSSSARLAIDGLTPLGFVVRGHFRNVNQTQISGFKSYVTLLESPSTCDTATVLTILAPRGPRRTLAFATESRDGTLFTTAHTDVLPMTPRANLHPRSMTFPKIKSARTLYQVHRARVDVTDIVGLPQGNLADYLKARALRQHAGWVAAGYYYLDPTGDRLRPTWKGAFLGTWKIMWPISSMRRAWRNWRARRVLRQLGLE